MAKRTRIIDLTQDNVTASEDVKVKFREYERHLAPAVPALVQIVNPDTMILQTVESLEAHDPLERGFTGFTDEKLVILCDLSDESTDKLIALENFINTWHEMMFRITDATLRGHDEDIDQVRPEIAVVWTELPYDLKDNIPTTKTRKLAAAMSWQQMMRNFLNIKYTAIGDYSASISPFDFYYNSKKVYVDTCLTGFYSGSDRAIVHTVNPMSDVLYAMSAHKMIDCDLMWVSPSIYSLLPSSYIEDSLLGHMTVRHHKDIEKLMYSRDMQLKARADLENIGIKVDPEVETVKIKNITCFATSLHDFMTFQGELTMFLSNYTSSSEPINVNLFIGYTPERADDQKLYERYNNFMDFIEDRSPLANVTFWMSDIEAAKMQDIEARLLKYVPKNLEIYPTKILDTLC